MGVPIMARTTGNTLPKNNFSCESCQEQNCESIPLKNWHLTLKPTQQVWGRLFHQLVHTALAHSYLPLHRHCYLYYQVQLSFPLKCWKLAQTAQITKIHETINSTESAKSQLLDALGWRWRTGSLQNKVAPNSRIQSYWVENLPSLAMFGGF